MQFSQEVVDKIKANDAKYLRSLYYQERASFVRWALKHHRLSEQEALEIYQSTFTAMYTNIKNDKLGTIASSVSTYLIGIGKNMIRKHFKNAHLSLDDHRMNLSDNSQVQEQEMRHQYVMIRSWLNQLGDPCRQILILYYYRRYSMEAIAREMGYKNENVAKKKKCLCLQSLRDQLNQATSSKEHE